LGGFCITANGPMSARIPTDGVTSITVLGRTLEVLRIPGRTSGPELVFLHEGLGSVSHWRDFPAQVNALTGCPVTVYSRYGSGASDVLAEPRPVAYMHDEALTILPALLEKLRMVNPVLIGHSDGGSIAIIYAGTHNCVQGIVLLAPHVFVEELSVQSIAKAKVAFQTTKLPEMLARHHRDAAATFWGWNNVWLDPAFRDWNIEDFLPRLNCPALVIQGMDDQYGTMAQVDSIRRQSGGSVEVLALPNCAHAPHRDQPVKVLEAIRDFVEKAASK